MNTSSDKPVDVGSVLTGPAFDEPMRVESVAPIGPGKWRLGLAGLRTERFRRVDLTDDQISQLSILKNATSFDGDGRLLRLGLQAYALGIAWEFDPYFGLSISRVDPLPHQLSAVYDHLLKAPRVRFLLADDAGAGKTIMAGLLIRELKLRGLAERILVVCPANLAFQWQRELKEKFDEKFLVIRGYEIRDQFGVNQWLEQRQVITSLDLAKREEILPGLAQVHWDLVIVDEAHRMSWTPPSRKTSRYALGELLRDTTDHLLLLTATPHKGDPENFSLFLQLLDADVYADVSSIAEAMERRHAPFYLRRTKEAMYYFPERQADGTWQARKLFKKRIPKTVDFTIDGDEFDLYRAVSGFVKRQSTRAAEEGEDTRARAVGFLMALYQRRLASSTQALRQSLENRIRRLGESLRDARQLAAQAPPVMPSPEDLEEMEDWRREELEKVLDAITLARNPEQVHAEIEELRSLVDSAKALEKSGREAKLTRLRAILESEGFFAKSDQRLLLFTEFTDTLDFLVRVLTSWGFKVGRIDGRMKAGSRDDPGTRLYSEQQFRDGGIQILVATEAAGEGINLQCCHILFNYDIPWNPNRLEQRMGRIHRYGQLHDCLIFNFVATNTIEGRILQKLLEKLQEIRDALQDDAVFNVVGEVLPAAHIERVLRDYYAGKLGDEDLEDRLLSNVEEGNFRAICQNALEGLASKHLNLAMLVERRARAQERRVVPETIARFILDSAPGAGLSVKAVPAMPHAFDPGPTPVALKRFEKDKDWRLASVAARYPRCSADRSVAERENLEWVTPGHALFEALRRDAWDRAQPVLSTGACFYSLQHSLPARLDFYRARVVDGLGKTIHERLFCVEATDSAGPQLRDVGIVGDLQPADGDAGGGFLGPMEDLPWLHEKALGPFLHEIQEERVAELDRVAAHVEISLTELIQKADEEIGAAAEEVGQNTQGAEGRLAQAEKKHADLLARRERRRQELGRQRALTLQSVERITSVLVVPHPERDSPDVAKLKSDPVTEATAMRVVEEYERAQGRVVEDVHEKNLGYDIRSLDTSSGELRLIEVKGIGASKGTVILTPNERRVAEDRRDCFWLYVVTDCNANPTLQEPIKDPARFPWHEVRKVDHYWLTIDALAKPMVIREDGRPYRSDA